VLHTYFLLASSANSADGEIFIWKGKQEN
jgi:hypothetical protein